MIKDDSFFSNKVDVWGLGCIFVELLTRKQAFENDFETREYYVSHYPVAATSGFRVPTIIQSHIHELTQELLHRKPSLRPRVAQLLPIFESYIQIIFRSANQTFNQGTSAPSFGEWKGMIVACRGRNDLVLPLLRKWFQFTGAATNTLIPLYRDALDQNPFDEKRRRQFKEASNSQNDINGTIYDWMYLVNRHPTNEQFRQELAEVCEQLGDINVTVEVWGRLVERHPTNISFISENAKAIIEASIQPGRDQTILNEETLTDLGILYGSRPRNVRADIMRKSLSSRVLGSNLYVLEVWKRIVKTYPDEPDYIEGLEKALREKDPKTQKTAWIELLVEFPSNVRIMACLKRVLPQNVFEQVGVWKMLLEEHPSNKLFKRELRIYLNGAGQQYKVGIWMDLLIKNPDAGQLVQQLKIELGYQDTDFDLVLCERMEQRFVAMARHRAFQRRSPNNFPELVGISTRGKLSL